MRLLVTADLHFNHAGSRPLAESLIDEMNQVGGDALLVVGDTAVADGDALETCLGRFRIAGPKVFVAGNHELWTQGTDSYELFTSILPRRVRAAGWHWLEDEPFRLGEWAIVGTVGWYDYSFAPPEFGIPRRFYQHKISPGAAERFEEYAALFEPSDDISPAAREVLARWNDGRFVKLHRPDEQFLAERLASLAAQLEGMKDVPHIIAASHHVPFRELLPPLRIPQWDFARAFLGSERIGELLIRYANIRHVFCGHSHFPAETDIGPIHAINIGSGYRRKAYRTLELP